MKSENKAIIRSLSGASLGAISLLLASQASAQTQPPPPPQPVNVDQNGVNLASRTLVLGDVDLAIGPNDHRGLQLVRQWAGQGWRIASTPVISGSTNDPVVVIGGRSITFTWNQTLSVYIPTIQDGSSLSSDMTTFTASDGTVVEFRDVQDLVEHPTAMKAASKITFADGVEHTFTYQDDHTPIIINGQMTGYFLVERLVSINSSTGYQIKLSYEENHADYAGWRKLAKATAINNKVEYCDPSSDTCTLTGDWPEVTYSSGGLYSVDSVTDPEGRTTSYGYAGSGAEITSITPPGTGSSPISFAYTGDKIDTVTRGGGTWTYSENAYGSFTDIAVQDPVANTNTFTFADTGQLRYQNIGGNVSGFEYCSGSATCADGLVQKITSPEGNYTELEYDSRANVTKITRYSKPDPNANPLTNPGPDPAFPAIETSATYPANCTNPVTCNKPISITDANGNVTDLTWDQTHGGITKVERPADATGVRPTSIFTYKQVQAYYLDGPGSWTNSSTLYVPGVTRQCRTAATCNWGAEERRTVLHYKSATTPNNALPAASVLRTGDNSLNQYTSYAYSDLGDLVTVNGPAAGGDTAYMFYNRARQLTGMIGFGDSTYDRQASRTIYDDAGRVWKQEFGHTGGTTETALDNMTFRGRTVTQYDTHGRPTTQFAIDANGASYSAGQASYDAAGRTTCTVQRMNPSTYTSLPSDACVPASEGAYGPDRIAKYSYDGSNRVTSVTNGFGTDDAVDSYTVTFTPNGRIATAMDAENNLTTYEYDGHDRNFKVRFPVEAKGAQASSTTDFELYAFDDNGNVTQFTTRAGETISLTYDALNRVTSKIVPDRTDGSLPSNVTLDSYFAYDLFGNLTEARYWGLTSGQGLSFDFDGLGRLTSETRFLGGITTTIQSGYDPETNQRTSMTYPDGKVATYTYDVIGRPETIALDSVNVAKYTFRQDGLVEKIERWRDNGSWGIPTRLGFDARSRMNDLTHDPVGTASDLTTTFSYNPAGQIFQSTKSNNAYAHAAPSDSEFAYTSNGLNQYTVADTANFTYDDNGNLTSDGLNTFVYDVENRLHLRTDAAGNVARMYYDPLGRLYKVTSSNSADRNYIYDGDALIEEHNWNGSTMFDRYLHGPGIGIDDPLIQMSGSSTALSNREYLYADERGSIVALGGADGSISDINTYDAYGVQAPGNAGRFRYTGQIYIPEMDLYYYKARMYSPHIGRFMQTDPIGYGDGMNMYRYVGNDPVNGIDPTGMFEVPDPCDLDPDKCIVVPGKKKDLCKGVCVYPDDPILDDLFGRNPLEEFFNYIFEGHNERYRRRQKEREEKEKCALVDRLLDASNGIGLVADGVTIATGVTGVGLPIAGASKVVSGAAGVASFTLYAFKGDEDGMTTSAIAIVTGKIGGRVIDEALDSATTADAATGGLMNLATLKSECNKSD